MKNYKAYVLVGIFNTEAEAVQSLELYEQDGQSTLIKETDVSKYFESYQLQNDTLCTIEFTNLRQGKFTPSKVNNEQAK